MLEVQRRSHSTVFTCIHGFWLLFMVGTLLALGLSGFSLLAHWVWLLATLFAAVTFAGYWVAQPQEAWLIFWSMWMLHGLLWLQVVLVAYDGVWPGTVWANFGSHSGAHLLMAQLGSVPLLLLPLVALLVFVWFERSYLQIVFYDFTSQLQPHHRIVNLVWCADHDHCPTVIARPLPPAHPSGPPGTLRVRRCRWRPGLTGSTPRSSPICRGGLGRSRC